MTKKVLSAIFTAALTMVSATGGETEEKNEPVLPSILQDRTTMLFYGDSLTDGSSYPDYVVNSLNAAFPKAGIILQNSAKCGDTTRNLLDRWEKDVLSKKPDLISICIGANDVMQKIPVAEYHENLKTLVERAVKENMHVVLFLTSPFADSEKDAKLQAFLKSVQSIATEFSLPVADAHGTFKAWGKLGKEVLGPDGLHHGKDGFSAMARAFLDGIGLQAIPLIETVSPLPGALSNWEISEPITVTEEPLEALAPSIKRWKIVDVKTLAADLPWWDKPFLDRGGVMPMVGIKKDNGKKRTVLARTIYEAKEAGPAELQIGGSPPLSVLCNGKEVWHQKRAHGYHPNADCITVTLRKGRNEFIVRTGYMAFLNLRKL